MTQKLCKLPGHNHAQAGLSGEDGCPPHGGLRGTSQIPRLAFKAVEKWSLHKCSWLPHGFWTPWVTANTSQNWGAAEFGVGTG